MTSYTSLRGLENIVLEESYVREIHAAPGIVRFRIEFALTRDHTLYAPPPPGQRECFRTGLLIFHRVRRLVWSRQGAPPATDADGEYDLGHIDSLTLQDAEYMLEGDWGEMEISAAALTVNFAE